jgi:hypothetical protein
MFNYPYGTIVVTLMPKEKDPWQDSDKKLNLPSGSVLVVNSDFYNYKRLYKKGSKVRVIYGSPPYGLTAHTDADEHVYITREFLKYFDIESVPKTVATYRMSYDQYWYKPRK